MRKSWGIPILPTPILPIPILPTLKFEIIPILPTLDFCAMHYGVMAKIECLALWEHMLLVFDGIMVVQAII